MHKIRGLITAIKGNEEASLMILPFYKRTEDYYKIINRINQVYYKVFIDPYASFVLQLSSLNKTILEDTKYIRNKPQSHFFIVQILSNVQKIINTTNHQIKSYLIDSFNAILDECQSIKQICDALYKKLNIQQAKEKELHQNIKKYSKFYKSFLQAMESYKIVFQDVKLIYNIEQKIKRYKQCSTFFTATVTDFQEIQQIIKLLTDQRSDIKGLLQKFKQKSLQLVQTIGQQIFKIPQNIVKCLMKLNKEILKLVAEKGEVLKDKSAKSIFEKFRLPFPNPQFFNFYLKESENGLYPSFVTNLKNIKDQHFGKSKKYFVEYYITIRQDIKDRSQMNEKLKTYFQGLNNLFDKFFLNEQKQIKDLVNERYIKAIQLSLFQSEFQNVPFKVTNMIKKMLEFLDQNRQLTKNMNKMYSQYLKQIVTLLDEENKILLIFKDQFKILLFNLFSGKKQFKKDLENLKSGEIQNLTMTEQQVKQMRPDILKKSEFITLLINGFNQKFRICLAKVKGLIEAFLDEYSRHQNYESVIYEKYKLKLEQLAIIFVQKRLQQPQSQKNKSFWINQNSLYQAIVHQNLKIRFDSQIDKVNQFKKLKKPVQNFEENNTFLSPQKEKHLSPAKKQGDGEAMPKSFGKNYETFVQENTKFEEGQKYVSNYTCGLCDNIIISGRLYITTNRLFFHSRFNSSNIFFGQTKLEIPRSDIKKIEKKYNAIIFDNSISITTVNGQIFFTSFISRDSAYDLICKTFDINIDQNVFVSEEAIEDTENQEEAEDFNLNLEHEDDMPDSDLDVRVKQIDEILQKDEASDEKAQQTSYQNVSSEDFTFPGLNAAKLFKIFQSGQEMPYKNKTFESFWHYFKGHLHKNEQLNVDMWEPNILDYLNPSNIKKDTPLKFSRRITTNIPAPQIPIPFMPKFIESDQSHELYLYSKDKYVIILKVKNSKAPYTDSFYLRYKKVVEKRGENTVRVENNLKLVFIKKTMMQGVIKSKTEKESIDFSKSMCDEMRKYLKYLQKTLVKKRTKKGQKVQDLSTTDGGILNESRNLQENQSNPSQNDNELKLQSLNFQQKMLKKVLGFSLFLNMLFLLIILYGKSSSPAIQSNQT